MSKKEMRVTLERAQLGMSLARPALDQQGHVVMSSGIELTDVSIEALRRRNVSEIWVVDVLSQMLDGETQQDLPSQLHQQRLARIFRHTGEGADDLFLLNLMTRYRGLEQS